LLVSSIRLASGEASPFHLNINGMSSDEMQDMVIPPRDSIYIFIEVSEDVNNTNQSFFLRDSIEFITNNNSQDVDLMAWSQEVNIVKNDIVKSETWTNDKPYLVSRPVKVAKNAVLTISAGTKIYFHHGTRLLVAGKIIAKGSCDQPIVFQTDRMEPLFQNLPDLWNGIVLAPGSYDNVLDFVEVRNAHIGLQVGSIEEKGFATAVIGNSRFISNFYAGIFSVKSKLQVYNTLIADYHRYGAALLLGGEYDFYHTTIANYDLDPVKLRLTPSLLLSNYLIVNKDDKEPETLTGDLKKAYFSNVIIAGDAPSGNEVGMEQNSEANFNFLFDHCLLQMCDTFNVSNPNHYKHILKGVNPRFADPFRMRFELDSISPARDAGLRDIGDLYPYDLAKQNRISDLAPDLGAYERIDKPKK
jgi:hypothetical protein